MNGRLWGYALLCLAFSASASYADTTTLFARSYRPLPVGIESKTMPSGMYVGVDERQLDKSVDAVANEAQEGTAEKALGHIVHALAENNPEEFAANTEADGSDGKKIRMMFDATRPGIPDAANVRVSRCFAIGGATLLVVILDDPKAPVWPCLFVPSNGKQVLSFKQYGHPVVQNIATLSRAIEADRQLYASAEQPTGCPLSITFDHLFGDDGQHPVTIRFNGYRLRSDGSEKDVAMRHADKRSIPVDYADALRVHGEAADRLIARDIEGYTSHLGAESQKWFAENSTNGRLNRLVENARFERHPTYLLGGSLLKVLLFAKKGDTDIGGIRELVVTPPGEKAQIVNRGCRSICEALLQWPEFGRLLMEQSFNASEQGASIKP